MIELAARKNVARRPRSAAWDFFLVQALVRRRAERDRVMKVEPARLQQAVDGLEIGGVIGDADMLEHADRGDLVELALDQRIVAQLDRHPVLEPEPRDLFLRIGELLLGERHADRAERHSAWRRDRRARPSRSRCRAGALPASGAACGRSCRACRAARSPDRCSSRGNRRSCRPSRDRERAHRTRWRDRSGSGRFPCWLLRSRPCAPRGREWPRAATARRAARTEISVAVASASRLSRRLRISLVRSLGPARQEIENHRRCGCRSAR